MSETISQLRDLAVSFSADIGRPDIVALAVFLIAIIGAMIVHRLLYTILVRSLNGDRERAILRNIRGPTRFVFVAAAITVALPIATFEPNIVTFMRRVLAVSMIAFAGWSLIVAINGWAALVERRYRIDVDDNLVARKHYTQTRLLRRAGVSIITLFTVAGILMTFPAVRDYGISLFASAGVAGLVAGLAARPVLSNLIAGVQIALTQPIRIDDVLIVEGEWGWVEEITSTYVVVRIWDWRRLVVPLTHFIEKPFENWTRESASIIGSVFWHVDYTAPIGKMREKLDEILAESTHWDRNIANLQVTEAGAETVQVRALMSARTSPIAWDLRCEVREKMLDWLQQDYPQALPRKRAELAGAGAAPAKASARTQRSASGAAAGGT
jgi:small-conductance mechanosensitive channel